MGTWRWLTSPSPPPVRSRWTSPSPVWRNVSEILVTGPGAPAIASAQDLSGKAVHVRTSSSYYESLAALNERLLAQGKAPVEVKAADEHIEDEGLLEMVQAGLIPAVVVDSHKAEFWAQIFENLDTARGHRAAHRRRHRLGVAQKTAPS